VELWDYYWPTLDNVTGAGANYLDYGPDGVKTVDLSIALDFSGYRYPFNATVSTLVGGNDYRYDENGENATRNFTTYVEAGYTFSNIFHDVSGLLKGIDLCPAVGAVLNNRAEYYAYGDYDRVSVVNVALSASREVELGYGCATVVSLNFTHNAAAHNLEPTGRNFVTAGMSFVY
jgi:hypothetical protein